MRRSKNSSTACRRVIPGGLSKSLSGSVRDRPMHRPRSQDVTFARMSSSPRHVLKNARLIVSCTITRPRRANEAPRGEARVLVGIDRPFRGERGARKECAARQPSASAAGACWTRTDRDLDAPPVASPSSPHGRRMLSASQPRRRVPQDSGRPSRMRRFLALPVTLVTPPLRRPRHV
jgi:hypothetical protein